ncbi:MAG TPA: response regulator [Rhodocyclaceae bacterium]|nr:response regulator [Rhodocyclaceae bacterium]HNH35469.1 response regulator [Rhodocyclaceae bacterium]
MSSLYPVLLIVDDQPESIALLISFLENRAMDIMVAMDGRDGLEKARAGHPDLILLDIAMPGMDGFAVCEALKANPATAAAPVIFLSASGAIDDKLRGFAAGAVDYITKPFAEDEVLARVGVHLHTRDRIARLETMVGQRTVQEAATHEAADERMFRAAVEIIEKRLAFPPSLQELSRQLGATDRKLTEIFRDRVGMTATDYFSEFRLETAKRLLEATDTQIQIVADRVGYRNPGDFTRAFRRRFGVGPREFRQATKRTRRPGG